VAVLKAKIMRSLQAKQQLRKALGMLQLATPSEFLWRSLTPQGRQINQKINDHQQRMIGLYSQFIRRDDLCFDIGANIGTRVETFLKMGARVIAVEPQQHCIDYLRAKYRQNKRVNIEPVGLDEAPGKREFLISTHSGFSTMSKDWVASFNSRGGKFANQRWDKSVTVQVTTLDILLQRYGIPVFCKIDVEGFEYQVLKGLSQPIPALSLECTPEHSQIAIDCVQRIAALGQYEFNYSVDETMTFVMPGWVDASAMRAHLDNVVSDNVTGDVYARLLSSVS
jgi:FkbM family methyltransferase